MLIACGNSEACLQVVSRLIKHFSFAEHTHEVRHSGSHSDNSEDVHNIGIVTVIFNNLSKSVDFSVWKSACCEVLGSYFCNSCYHPSVHKLQFSLYTEPDSQEQSSDYANQDIDVKHDRLKSIIKENMHALEQSVKDFKLNVAQSNLQYVKDICTVWTTRTSLNMSDSAQNIDIPLVSSGVCNLQIEVEADPTDIISSSAALLPMQFTDFVVQLDLQNTVVDYSFALFFSSLNGIRNISLCVLDNQIRIFCKQPQDGGLLKTYQTGNAEEKGGWWNKFYKSIYNRSNIVKTSRFSSRKTKGQCKIHTF
jgi:hypothetical protein